mgnify:CR=1 FL=1
MNIALITITYNDLFKFEEWVKYYEGYKDEIGLHIIVDNGSDKEYLDCLKRTFRNSFIIERATNGGTTAAYNDGIRHALEDKNIDAIMLLGNDIKLKNGAIKILYDYLYSDEKLGMVAPILLKKDTNYIESFGISMNWIDSTSMNNRHQVLDDNIKKEMFVDYVPGGISLSKREFYENIGFQDEKLFMYGDERDICYRSRKFCYLQGVTSKSIAWHQHISSPYMGERLNSNYLIGRNFVYIGLKNRGGAFVFVSTFFLFIKRTLLFLRDISAKEQRFNYFQFCRGIKNGLLNNMNNNDLWY